MAFVSCTIGLVGVFSCINSLSSSCSTCFMAQPVSVLILHRGTLQRAFTRHNPPWLWSVDQALKYGCVNRDRLISLATTTMMGFDGIQWSGTLGPPVREKGLDGEYLTGLRVMDGQWQTCRALWGQSHESEGHKRR
ncbi:hypothetical protein VNO77_25113 [Canavalia gladiata]|uniref:Uncharacterized protein n=1 Tax=Canavalia gladiata TaxID=3824 RepID=A0AAN9LA12_CANGL